MQVYAGGNGSFNEGFAQIVLTEDDERNGAFDARAAPGFFLHEIIWSPCKRRLAHGFSLARRLDFQWSGSLTGGVLPLLFLFLWPDAQMLAERGVLVEWFPPSIDARNALGLKSSFGSDEKGSL